MKRWILSRLLAVLERAEQGLTVLTEHVNEALAPDQSALQERVAVLERVQEEHMRALDLHRQIARLEGELRALPGETSAFTAQKGDELTCLYRMAGQ